MFFRAPDRKPNLWEFRAQFADVIIEHSQGTLEANKIILAASSGYFKRILETESSRIKLTHLSENEADSILRFIYCGAVNIATSDLKRFQEITAHLAIKLGHLGNGNINDSDPSRCKNVSRHYMEEFRKKFPNSKVPKKKVVQSNKVTSIQPEIWIKIFSFLPTNEIFKSIAFVSKQFYRLSKDPWVHVHVTISGTIDVHTSLASPRRLRFFNQVTDILKKATKMKCCDSQIPRLSLQTVTDCC